MSATTPLKVEVWSKYSSLPFRMRMFLLFVQRRIMNGQGEIAFNEDTGVFTLILNVKEEELKELPNVVGLDSPFSQWSRSGVARVEITTKPFPIGG